MRVGVASRRPRPSGVAEGLAIPAPVGGWDGVSALADMPPNRAYQLDNWVPRPGWIEPRKGYRPYATGLGTVNTPVQTVMAYNGSGATNKLFGVAGGKIYDVTLSGAAVDTGVAFGNSRLQHLMFSNASATADYLIAVSGQDMPKAFNGTGWNTLAITVASGSTSFDPTTFVSLASHKGRLWFVPMNSTGVVYLDTVGGIQGTAHFFPLGQLMSRGGYVMAVGTWTADSNQTLDEYIAFVTSRGQVIVYQGTDPSTAGTWSMVGVYNIGPAVGRRCLLRTSGELLIITLDGVVPMTELMGTDRAAVQKITLTSNIMNPMAQAAQAYKSNFGWQMIAYAKGTLAILNIPTAENLRQMQFVMNTITGAWCRFFDLSLNRGLPANCWEIDAADNIYFGGNDGTVYRWDIGASDNGQPINCLVKSAYNPAGNGAQLKRFTSTQPLITTTGNPIPSVGINMDFSDSATLSLEQPIQNAFANWNQVKWNQFNWAEEQSFKTNWGAAFGIGHYVSVATAVTTTTNPSNPDASPTLQLNGWNLTFERGAFI